MYQNQISQNNQNMQNMNANYNTMNSNNIDVNVYLMALKSGNVIDFLNNVKDKAPYVQDELTILQSTPQEQKVFINNVAKRMNMTEEQYLAFSNQMIGQLLQNK